MVCLYFHCSLYPQVKFWHNRSHFCLLYSFLHPLVSFYPTAFTIGSLSPSPAPIVTPVSLSPHSDAAETRRHWGRQTGRLCTAMGCNDGACFYKKPSGSWIDIAGCQIARYPERTIEDPELAAVLGLWSLRVCVTEPMTLEWEWTCPARFGHNRSYQ